MKLIVAKVVDDLLIGGIDADRKAFVDELSSFYKIGTLAHLPGKFNFFGLVIEQEDTGTIRLSADDKLHAVSPHTLTRLRRKSPEDNLNSVELFSYQSINGKLGFLGTTVSPFASFTSSHLQQAKGSATVHDLVKQNTMLKVVKQYGTVTKFSKIVSRGPYQLTVAIFSNAGRPSEYGQLGYVGGLLIGPLSQGSHMHTIT